jgi:transcriptional regulator with XRE-family HTH domain
MAAAFGDLLRSWRRRRGLSQLQLSGLAEVSTRHLSWLEAGKSAPSRAMVLRLAERLDVPLRQRNGLLGAAGFAPMYRQLDPDAPAWASARAAIQQLLDAHEPWPALAVDRGWQMVAHNRLVPLLLSQVAPELAQPPVNVLRLSLHPQGLAPLIEGLEDWREHVLLRLQRQTQATADPALQRLHDELQALPAPPGHGPWSPRTPAGEPPRDSSEVPRHALSDLAVPLVLRSPWGRLSFISTVTVFGAPRDVSLAELAIETLLPADAATAQQLRTIAAQLPPRPPLAAPSPDSRVSTPEPRDELSP